MTGFETSVRGALYASDGRGRTAVIRRNGRQRVYETGWHPLTWSPDGATILMVRRKRLGLLSLADGTVREIGGADAAISQAVWVPKHPY